MSQGDSTRATNNHVPIQDVQFHLAAKKSTPYSIVCNVSPTGLTIQQRAASLECRVGIGRPPCNRFFVRTKLAARCEVFLRIAISVYEKVTTENFLFIRISSPRHQTVNVCVCVNAYESMDVCKDACMYARACIHERMHHAGALLLTLN